MNNTEFTLFVIFGENLIERDITYGRYIYISILSLKKRELPLRDCANVCVSVWMGK